MKHVKIGDLTSQEVKGTVDHYTEINDSELNHKKQNSQLFVNHYYDLATDFYERGWGSSFHFAPRKRGESLKASLIRQQQFLADQVHLKPGMEVLDIGCGVGGPMANLIPYTGARFVGLNNNPYQIKRAKQNTRNVQPLPRLVCGDFMQIPESDNSFDCAIAIESLPHAPDKIAAYKEVYRVLRPGAYFTGQEWCLTEHYDSHNPQHLRIKKDIEIGCALPDIASTSEVCAAFVEAGFEIIDVRDVVAAGSQQTTPWYRPLQGREFSLASIPRTPIGRTLTNLALKAGEKLRLVPEGSAMVSTILNKGADALVESGEVTVRSTCARSF